MTARADSLDGWQRVNRNDRCPICGKPDWCMVSAGGSALCMRWSHLSHTSSGTVRWDSSTGWLIIDHLGPLEDEPQPAPDFREMFPQVKRIHARSAHTSWPLSWAASRIPAQVRIRMG